jgi:hypothetical protein
MQIVETEKLEWELVVPNTRGGDVFRKMIRSAEEVEAVTYDVRIERFGEGDRGYNSIRHRHDFEQLRFAVSGTMDLGFAPLKEGDVGYFPANAYYGPQRCEGAVVLIAQWGDRFITQAASNRAVAELSAVGAFVDGIYRSVDVDGKPFNKDPLNSIWEQVFKEPYKPQTPRYSQPVVITPGAFGWSEPDGPVQYRHHGVFTENSLAIETVRWVADGAINTHPAEQDDRPVLIFTTAGRFNSNETTFGALTGVWVESGESAKIEAVAGSEALVVRFPAPSSRITLGLGA